MENVCLLFEVQVHLTINWDEKSGRRQDLGFRGGGGGGGGGGPSNCLKLLQVPSALKSFTHKFLFFFIDVTSKSG